MAPNITTGKACVTFLAGNGDYVKGVVGSAKGLRKVKTKYPLVVAILPNVYGEILVSQGCIVREIKSLCIHLRIKPDYTRSLLSVSVKSFFFFLTVFVGF